MSGGTGRMGKWIPPPVFGLGVLTSTTSSTTVSSTTTTSTMLNGKNARVEFLKHVEGREILCAKLWGDAIIDQPHPDFFSIGDGPKKCVTLTVGHTEEEYRKFLEILDREYDDGYGSQKLFGTVWYKDMTWSTRAEYDGSEWWVYHSVPEIPFELWRKTTNNEQKENA